VLLNKESDRILLHSPLNLVPFDCSYTFWYFNILDTGKTNGNIETSVMHSSFIIFLWSPYKLFPISCKRPVATVNKGNLSICLFHEIEP